MAEVRLTKEGRVAVLWLSHPQRGNALTVPMMIGAAALLRSIRAEDCVAVVVRGEGERAFCSGYDLLDLPRESQAVGDAVLPELMSLLAAIEEVPVPVIAAVSAPAIGGGVLLAAHCDVRIGGAGVRLRIPTTRIGMVYPLRGVRRLVALAGLGAATRWLLFGEDIAVEDALRCGLLDEVVPPDEVVGRALALARVLEQRAPLAVGGLLRTLRALGHGVDDADVVRIHREALAACVASEDLVEGIAAAAARREPIFKGR